MASSGSPEAERPGATCRRDTARGAGIPFYYSIVLFYFTLLSPLFAKMMKQKCQGLLYMSIGCTLILTIGGYFVQQFTGNAGWIKLTPICLGFYVAGMLQGERKLKTRSTQCQAWIIWIVAYIIQVVESYVLLQNVRLADIAYSQLRLGAFLYAAATINLMLAMESQLCVRKSLAYIGDRSYGIYFIHCIFLSIMAAVLNRIHIAFPLPILRAIQFGVAVGGSLIVIFVLKKLLKKYARSWFGV